MNYPALVTRVIDGDTYELDVDLGLRGLHAKLKVRLYGIDAPETTGRTKEAGLKAAEYVRQVLTDATNEVTLASKGMEDSFGRSLGSITLADGRDLANCLLVAGHAKIWTREVEQVRLFGVNGYNALQVRVAYADIRQNLRTGDVVLSSGSSTVSALIKLVTGCDKSHVGMVALGEDINPPQPGRVFVWESPGSGPVGLNDLDKSFKKGQVESLSGIVNRTAGDVVIRHLEVDRTSEMMAMFRSCVYEFSGRPWEQSKVELIGAIFGKWGNQVEDLSSLFCSETVAETHQRMGLLPEFPGSNTYRPRDYTALVKLPWQMNAFLGPEILLEKQQ